MAFELSSILLLLPLKSLVRFRCVSKEWASHLSRPCFTKLYLQQQQQNLHLIARDGLLYSLDRDSLDCAFRVDHHLLKDTDFTVKKVLGCSNALVCLSVSSSVSPVVEKVFERTGVLVEKGFPEYICTTDYFSGIIVICGLGGGVVCNVPSSPIVFQEDGLSLRLRLDFRRRINFWFGFDPSCNDYKLVRISQHIYKRSPSCTDEIISEINVYSMKSNSWTRFYPDISNYIIADSEPVLVCGALHWLACKRKTDWVDCEFSTLILAFDITGATDYSVRVLPINYRDKNCPKLSLGSMGGCLCALSSSGPSVEFLMMEEYGDANSWNIMASLPSTLELNFKFWYPESLPYDKALAFSKCGGKVLVERDKDIFVCCDLTKETGNKSQIHFISFGQPPKKRKLCN